MNKKESDFNVSANNPANNKTVSKKDFFNTFIFELVDTFKNGAGCLLEAKRIVTSRDKNIEIDLILNDEKETDEMKMKKQFPHLK